MQDAQYFVFEDAAAELGLITEFADLADPSRWWQGEVHARLAEGQLLRSRAPTRILDARLFKERTHRFMEWAIATEKLSAPDEDPPRKRAVSDKQIEQRIERELGHIRNIGDVYALLMADQISIRQFPCGRTEPALSLAGTLLARPGYLQEERETLFGTYGTAMSEWTMVSQVATLPRKDEDPPSLPDDPGDDESGAERRRFFEDMADFGMRTFEEQGFAASPSFPSIQVRPLAVYREVPTQ
jgi:hypothetical protein